MLKKVFITLSSIAAGMALVFGGIRFFEKKREKALGGKLIRVNYTFTKNFED